MIDLLQACFFQLLGFTGFSNFPNLPFSQPRLRCHEGTGSPGIQAELCFLDLHLDLNSVLTLQPGPRPPTLAPGFQIRDGAPRRSWPWKFLGECKAHNPR
jgi:hypothetical protein